MLLKYKNNPLGYFRFYYSVLGKKLLLSICLMLTGGVLDSVGLTMLLPLLQSVAGEKAGVENADGFVQYFFEFIAWMGLSMSLGSVLLLMLGIFILKGLAKYIELCYQAVIGPYFMKKVRYGLIKGLQQISFTGFIGFDAGSLQNTFVAEVQRMSQAFRYYFTYIQAMILLLTYVIFAMFVNFQFSLLVSLSALLTNLLYSRIYKRIKSASSEISKKGDDINDYMIQAVHYFKYLKSTGYLEKYSRKLLNVINRNEYLNRKIGTYSAVTLSLREPMIVLIVISVIYLQVTYIGTQLGSIILSLILFYRALSYLIVIQQNWQNFLQFTGSLANVASVSARMEEKAEMHGAKPFTSLTGDIIIKNVDVAFGRNKVLNRASLLIPNKQTIALVGESGSGKTTLANLVMGLIPPDQGEVLIGDTPLKELDLHAYRSKIGYISQDPVIFNDNIFNNVTFWAEPNEENKIKFRKVIEAASLAGFVDSLSQKELAILGNNGIMISGGQKQRISIAREMFKDVEILILDEATSALDSQTELIIQENIEKLHGQYTMIVIAHRLSTIKNVDKIYLIDNGNAVISGNFENMVEQSEKFKRMVALQGL